MPTSPPTSAVAGVLRSRRPGRRRGSVRLPLRLGGIRLGTLTLNQAHAGRLTDEQYAEAMFIVGIVTRAVLTIQAKAFPGTVAGALEALVYDGAEVHQAAGMLAVRLGVGVGEALVRLRALAYAEGRSVADLAHDVVTGAPMVGY